MVRRRFVPSLVTCFGLALLGGCTLARSSLSIHFDAGATLDDAGLDAGAIDAGAIDAGAMDAGPADGGPPDAGPPDLGVPDTGPPDAWAPDVGPPPPPLVSGLTLLLDERGQEPGVSGVAAWRDQSGMHHDLLQPGGASQPTIGRLAGWPAPRFDGLDDSFVGPDEGALTGSTGASITLVIDISSPASGVSQNLVYSYGSGGFSILVSPSGQLAALAWNGTSYYSVPAQPVTAGIHLVQLRFNTGTISLRLDAAAATTVAAPLPVAGFGPFVLGGTADGRISGFTGTIVFVAITAADIDEGQNTTLRAYLATKYGVTS